MARLVVLSSPTLGDGFRLAGCTTVLARVGPTAVAAARDLASRGDIGLLLVTADLWDALGDRLRSDLERLGHPVVMPVPAGAPTDPQVRGQILGEMLQRAIGYRIQLSAGGEP